MDLSIIIVNKDTSALLTQCLNSIYTAGPHVSFEVIVVDNGSSDDSVRLVENNFPNVVLIKNEQNLGFAKANNQGFAIAKGRYLMLLNSDTVMCPGTVDALMDTADSHSNVGVIGPILLNADNTIQKSWASFPSFLSEVLGKNFRVRKPVRNLPAVYDVDWIMGACMLVRSETVNEVGMMDGDYFFYSEEVDWCYRIKEKNWKIWLLTSVQIYHLGGGSTSRGSVAQLVNLYRGKLRFFKKFYGDVPTTALRFGLAFVNALGVCRRILFLNWFNRASSVQRIANQSKLVWYLLSDRYPETF
jgi:GT2 family glycosyltransferase